MPNSLEEQAIIIQSIQVRRGKLNALNTILVGENKPKKGEPIYATDVNQLKFGDGEHDYIDLKPFNTSTAINFAINDPLTEEILLFNSSTNSWTNHKLYDNDSIVYIKDKGLSIRAYEGAAAGTVPVKDLSSGIKWVTPVSEESLNQIKTATSDYATTAKLHADEAAQAKLGAEFAEAKTEQIITQFMSYCENKFWQGTLEQYNELSSINEDSIYFIKVGK